jgi:hypothetical protein
VTHLFVGSTAFDRLAPLASPGLHAALGGASALLFAGTLAGFALGGLVRRLMSAAPSPLGRGTRALACALCAVNLVILVGVVSQLLDVRLWDMMIGVPPALRAMLWLPLVAAPLTLALAVAAARGFRPGVSAPLARLHLAALLLAALLVLAGYAYWRIWPFDLPGAL